LDVGTDAGGVDALRRHADNETNIETTKTTFIAFFI
jgi:hypothetical protein